MTEQEEKMFIDNTRQLLAMCKVIYDNAVEVGFPQYMAIKLVSDFFISTFNKTH